MEAQDEELCIAGAMQSNSESAADGNNLGIFGSGPLLEEQECFLLFWP